MRKMNDLIYACREWPSDMEKIRRYIIEADDLNSPVKFAQSEFKDPLLAVIENYPYLSGDLFDEYQKYDFYDMQSQFSLFEKNGISNRYLPEIIKLFLENGYDIHAGEGEKAAILLAYLYYGPKYTDSYVFDSARLIVKEEPRALDFVRKVNIYGSGEGDDDDDDDDSYLDLEDDLYRAYTLYRRICWDEDDCIVPDSVYPLQHKCTSWIRFLEYCFAGKDPAYIDYYDRLYDQKIRDIIITECSEDSREGRDGQYSTKGKIWLVCENHIAVIDRDSLYIDDSYKDKKIEQGAVLPSFVKNIVGQTIVTVESRQLEAKSEQLRISYPGFKLTIRFSNDLALIVTDEITEEERKTIENESIDADSYQERMHEYWNTRIYVTKKL